MTKVLSRKDLIAWLEGLLKDRVVVAPTRVGDMALFAAIDKVDDIDLDARHTVLSPKGWFFPRTDTLFVMERKDGGTELKPTMIEKEAVLFGLRPCDAKGLTVMDKSFLDDPADAIYAQRRAKTTLVGLACTEAMPQCFCTSAGSGPHDAGNLDILLIPAGEGYIVEAATEKGKALLESASLAESEVQPPPPPEVPNVPAEGIEEAMRRSFDDDYWGRLADRCLHCNTCAYVCPTCYCFDIRDDQRRGTVERLRCWDSCQSPGFTRIAGGHTPRPTKGSRLRQRFYHKLLYLPGRSGALGCVGCGRCVVSCPVNIDIRQIISDIQSLGVKSGS